MGGVILAIGVIILGVTFLMGFQCGRVPTIGLAIGVFLTFMGLRSVQGGQNNKAETSDTKKENSETRTSEEEAKPK